MADFSMNVNYAKPQTTSLGEMVNMAGGIQNLSLFFLPLLCLILLWDALFFLIGKINRFPKLY